MSKADNTAISSELELALDEKKCSYCDDNVIKVKTKICPYCGVHQRKPVSKIKLLLLTLFLGGAGGHKFYLGKNWQGILYLLFNWTQVPRIIAFIEFIIYASTSSDKLNKKYSADGSTVVIVIVFVVYFFLLSAIFIPAYTDYIKKSKVSEAYAMFLSFKTELTPELQYSDRTLSSS